MENRAKKCSFKSHEEIDANFYCSECKVYMCYKCETFHSKLCQNHHTQQIDKNNFEIFTGFCKEKNHFQKLEYFCINHNQLCCAACLCKIKDKGNGQHNDCNVCIIEKIKDEKKNKLNENIQFLEEISLSFQQSFDELKKIFENLKQEKEELKISIQGIFTKMRNILNKREDELIFEIENQYNNLFFKEETIKKSENLKKKIQLSLEKGKKTDQEWINDKSNDLNSLINNCINIENNIKDICLIKENIIKYNSDNFPKIQFWPDEEGVNNILNSLKNFGHISKNEDFRFRKCPKDIEINRKYIVSGEKENIVTKIGIKKLWDSYKDQWMGILCQNQLEDNKEYKWKIKILKGRLRLREIMVGVAPIDFDINHSCYDTCGWYLYCRDSTLYSGPPHNYNMKETNLSKIKDEVVIVMNMSKKTLKFIIDNIDCGDSYTNIPLNKPITPAVLINNNYDSVEIIKL